MAYPGKDAVGHSISPRRHPTRKRRDEGKHQERRQPPEPDPGPGNDSQERKQANPPPAVSGERSKTSSNSERYAEIHRAASAADHAANRAQQQPEEQCVGGELPDEYVHQHDGQDNDHDYGTNDVDRPPST